MQPAKPPAKTMLRERNLPRKQAAITGEIFGIRPAVLIATTLAVLALVWFLYGWLTYPVVPSPRG